MNCKNCLQEIKEGTQFCPHCGAKVENEEIVETHTYCENCMTELSKTDEFCSNCGAKVKKEEKKTAKCWSVFAKVAHVLGIVCISTCFVPFVSFVALSCSVPGIVFSCLGKKSIDADAEEKCKKSLTRSILGVIFGLIFYIVPIFLCAILGEY